MGAGVRHTRMAGRRRTHRDPPMSEINVTPFVDVMLVLLIIFMVAAPLLTVGVPLKLPETAANPLPHEQEEPLTVSLNSEGQVFLQSIEIGDEGLVPKLRAVLAERSTDRVFLRADAALDYGRVMEVMGALNGAGIRNIGLVTEAAPQKAADARESDAPPTEAAN